MTNFQFLNSDDTMPTYEAGKTAPTGPKVTTTKSYSLSGSVPGTKGITSSTGIWPTFCSTRGSKVCRVDATGTVVGDLLVSPSAAVTHIVDIDAEIRAFAQSRIAALQTAGLVVANPTDGQRETLHVALTAATAAAMASVGEPLHEGVSSHTGLMTTTCETEIEAIKRGAIWLTDVLGDKVAVEAAFEATVLAAMGL